MNEPQRLPDQTAAQHDFKLDHYFTTDTLRLAAHGYVCRFGCGTELKEFIDGRVTPECSARICYLCTGRFDSALKEVSAAFFRSGQRERVCSECAAKARVQLISQLDAVLAGK